MPQNLKKNARLVIGVLVILALLATAHLLFNYYDLVEILKAMHGG